MKEIIITQSLYFPNTFYIFREVGDNQYYEIEVVLDYMNDTIKCSRRINLEERSFIRQHLLNGKIREFDSAINDKIQTFETFKKTYHEHER